MEIFVPNGIIFAYDFDVGEHDFHSGNFEQGFDQVLTELRVKTLNCVEDIRQISQTV